jgi:hypothetical protein
MSIYVFICVNGYECRVFSLYIFDSMNISIYIYIYAHVYICENIFVHVFVYFSNTDIILSYVTSYLMTECMILTKRKTIYRQRSLRKVTESSTNAKTHVSCLRIGHSSRTEYCHLVGYSAV